MPINVTYPPFVSETIMFANRAAANSFFNQVTVPNATTTTYGVVKTALPLTYTWSAPVYDPILYVVRVNYNDDGGNPLYVDVAPQSTIDQMILNINQLKAIIDDLKTKLQVAGSLG